MKIKILKLNERSGYGKPLRKDILGNDIKILSGPTRLCRIVEDNHGKIRIERLAEWDYLVETSPNINYHLICDSPLKPDDLLALYRGM